MNKVNIILVGLGGMGKVHYSNYKEIPAVEVVAVVGKGEEDERTANSFSVPFFTSLGEAIKAFPFADIVDITTPSFIHYNYVSEALEKGKHVICEKPLSLSSKEAKELFEQASKKQLTLNVGHVMRYTHEFSALKKIVEEKTYGNVIDASFSRISSKPLWSRDSWLFDKSKSGLIPFDLHIHDLDMMVALFGMPKRSKHYVAGKDSNGIYLYHNMVYIYDGFQVNAEAGWLESSIPFNAVWRVIFEKAVVEYDGKKVMVYPWKEEPFEVDTSYSRVISTGINLSANGWYYEELKYFIDSFLDNPRTLIDPDVIVGELSILESM